MNWISVRVRAPASARDDLLAALFELGAAAVQEDGDALLTHFEDTDNADELYDHLTGACPLAIVDLERVPDRDWSERWKAGIHAHVVGDITISPPWRSAECDPERTIVIEPEMAFGTGEHESTRVALRLLQATVRKGDIVADLGAGSGILAIAAAKRGARRVAAIELDPQAIPNAEYNVYMNGVADLVTVIEGDATVLLPLLAPVDTVVANITSGVLTSLLPVIDEALAPKRECVLSGMLEIERGDMIQVLADHGWAVAGEARDGEWWGALIRRR